MVELTKRDLESNRLFLPLPMQVHFRTQLHQNAYLEKQDTVKSRAAAVLLTDERQKVDDGQESDSRAGRGRDPIACS